MGYNQGSGSDLGLWRKLKGQDPLDGSSSGIDCKYLKVLQPLDFNSVSGELPSMLWEAVERYSRIDSIDGIALLSVVILVLSNVASNVPTVLLVESRVAASAALISASKEACAWLILAWVSTVAGNLSLLGSAANLIVCEQARRAQFYGHNLSFWSHLKFRVLSTIIVTTIGLPLIRSY
ncbi:hypothetical protein IEQ34_007906 [Dendrobium chrysotoxum]|uniref:Citrate transporter-like domain-containing protein n=1 Tax=Dendrobium chrysotoxum TaxID=161865 RepID=A0AAV7H6P6_DENCH|nr:hypothetical protein IEQ34_007906 [Dendrobium chrysotoxum]